MSESYIKRFNAYHRVLHVIMAVSFLGLVSTGMPLRYAQAGWAPWLMGLFGGRESAGLVHRFCAVVTFGYFFLHLAYVAYYVAVVRKFMFDIFGPESMVPRLKDLEDMFGNFKWFVGVAPRPGFDRWSYWEKFDYWAVFWGVAIIGLSGLSLWFPGFSTRFLPGWVLNVATIVHSDEALLAAGFIFTIHFFNSHLRPEKFPMDITIFTGSVRTEELKREKPLEYARLESSGELESAGTEAPARWLVNSGIALGLLLITVGFSLLVLIINGQFFN